MKIAIAQAEIIFEQPEENLANAAAWIAQAAAAQADCIVFPEMSFTGFSMQVEKIAGYAPKIHEKMRQLAVQCGIAIGYGWTSQEQHGKGENHYTLLDKTGALQSLLSGISAAGASVVTITQSRPENGTAQVEVTVRTGTMQMTVEEMLSRLARQSFVVQVHRGT